MEGGFSEFSYAFALTRELAGGRFGRLTAAPVLPSLYREGHTGGEDIKIPFVGAPWYVQFKISHFLHRSNASEWEIFNDSYYRMYLRPLRYSKQHRLLMKQEKKGKIVHYAAPRFHTVRQLNRAYINQTVFDNSIFFSPLGLGMPQTQGVHYIAFDKPGTCAGMCSSEFRPVKNFLGGKQFAEQAESQFVKNMSRLDEKFFSRLTDELVSDIHVTNDELYNLKEFGSRIADQKDGLREQAKFAAYLTRVFFDAEMFIVSQKAGLD